MVATNILDETAHDALDHTGLTGVGGSVSSEVGTLAAQQSLSANTTADINNCSVSLTVGTWLVLARATFKRGAADGYGLLVIADGSDTALVGARTYVTTAGSVMTVNTHLLVTPGSTTTYKLRARASSTHTIETSDNVLAGSSSRLPVINRSGIARTPW